MKFLLTPSLYVSFLALISFELFARAGGGGGGGGGGVGGGRGGPVSLFIMLGAYLVSVIIVAQMNHRISARRQQVQKALRTMREHEPEWDEEKLLSFAKDQFMNIQKLWGTQNLEGLRLVLDHKLFLDWERQIEEQIRKEEINPFLDLVIRDAFIVDVKNYINDSNDIFTICFDAIGKDQTFRKGKLISTDHSEFREFWVFRKQMGEWKLYGVNQADGWRKFVDGNLVFEKLEKKPQHTIM